jgi:hypothetical protein
MSGIEGKKGYYLQKTGARVNELLERHYIVPTFTTSPTEDTLSWDDEGYIIYFRVGEIIRVKTPEGYDFYRVNDIKDNRINWVKIDTPSDTYTKDEIDTKFFTKEDTSNYISEKLVNYYSKREVDGKIEHTNKSVLEQTERVNNFGVELKNKASAEQVNKLESGLETTKRSIAEQTTKVTALQSEIKTKASTQSVTQLGDSVNIISDTVAEQTIRTDELEASIETKVSQEVFDATTGDINSEFIAVKQTTDAIETAVKSQSGEITVINENVNGLSISLGTIESELDSLRNQMDGTTESYFEKWVPTNENEPAKTWIEEGKEEEHKGDTFTNTSLYGEDAGKSWRWLQDDNGNWGWQPIADTDALKALEAAAKAQEAADGKVTIYYEQPSNYKLGDIWFVHNNSYSPYKQGEILSAKTENTLFSISDWESKTRYTQAVEDLNDVMITTFKDGVLTEAERISIIESITSIANEQAAVQARYNIIIINANLTDETLKNEYKATKVAYDTACTSLINIVEQIADAKAENLESLFDSYTQLSDDYSEAYATHNEKESEINNALMGRLNPANVYIDNITDDGILTPIEKEQLFEIYRNIAREYDATRSNALNYKVWKYGTDGITEESGLNGGEGRYNNYIAFKSAYNNVASVFSSSMWGFTQMKESTTLPEGYTTTLLKGYLDTYYEAYGILTESFSAITAAIEAAQKAAEETLQGLTDNLRPEEMSTIVGKGVVLSTIIATKDGSGKLTAGINGSLDQNKGEKSIAAWFGGDVVDVELDTDKPNPASSVIRHDGTGYFAKGLFSWDGNTGINLGRGGININYDGSLDFGDDIRIGGTETLGSLLKLISKLSSMWRLENGVLKTDYDVLTNGQFAAATVGAEGGGSVGVAYLADLYDVSLGSLLSGDILSWNGSEWVNIKQSSIVPDLSAYATKSFVTDSLVGYATQSDVTSALSNYLPLSGGIIDGGAQDTPLVVKSNASTTWIKFVSSDNANRYLGVDNSNSILYINSSGTFSLYHTGNFNPSDYLPKSGGTISGSYADPLIVNTSNASSIEFKLQINGNSKSSYVWDAYNGVYLYSYPSKKFIGIMDDGTPYYYDSARNTLIHSGNYSDYAVKYVGGSSIDAARHCIGYDNTSEGSANMPDGYGGGFISADQGHYGFQMLGVAGINKLYFRSLYNDTYLDWSEIIHSGNIGSQSVAYANAIKEYEVLDFVNQESATIRGWHNWGNPTETSFAQYTHGIVATSLDGNVYHYLGFANGVANPHVRSFSYGADSGWKTIAFIDNNVASATKLETARRLWGQSFDGTGDVSGNLILNNQSAIHSYTTSGTALELFNISSNNNLSIGYSMAGVGGSYIYGNEIYLRYGSSRTTGIILNSSGNVLIGTTASRGYKLNVEGGKSHFDAYNGANTYVHIGPAAFGLKIESRGDGNTYFQSQRFDSTTAYYNIVLQELGGNVAIGTTNPQYTLDVAGTLRVTDTLTAQNGITTNEITIGGIKIDVVDGALRINGNIYSTGQFGAALTEA